jgi:acyl-CoA synthetase (AMP-forming)/AMP-acid ligase II
MAPTRPEEKERFETELGVPLLENYALSETTFITSELVADRVATRGSGGVGRPVPWVQLAFDNASSLSGPPEIRVRTPYLFDGYFEAPDRIHLPTDDKGFFPTGDLGELDAGGALVLRGRSKEVIKKGGYLLVLRDIEEIAVGHPSVLESVAIGVPHDFYGEAPVLCLRLRDGAVPREALLQVRAAVIERLAKFKWPTEIVVLRAFPLTESGKVKSSELARVVEAREGVVESVALR